MRYADRMKKTCLLLSLLSLALSVYAGPFGISLDWTEEELYASGAVITAVSDKDPSGTALYQLTPERPDPAFSHYAAEINDTFGLWRIIALSDRYPDSKSITGAFGELVSRITEKYGEPMMESDTFIKLSSPEIFARLALGETYVVSILIPDPPVEDFTVLYLSVESDDGETGYIHLECWSLYLSLLINSMS